MGASSLPVTVTVLGWRGRRRLAESEALQRMLSWPISIALRPLVNCQPRSLTRSKQPLAAMVAQGGAAIRWLGCSIPDLDEVKSALEKIVESGHRANQIIENLRAMF
jgi:hypothetical protein